MTKRSFLLIGTSLSAAILLGFIYYNWPTKTYSFVPRYTDPSYYNESKEGYIVWEPQCEIPDIKPFDESVLPYIKTYKLENCTDKPLLTSIVREKDLHKLVLHEKYKHFYSDDPDAVFDCCYSVFKRGGKNDNQFRVRSCTPFKNEVWFWRDEEFVIVKCKLNGTNKGVIYRNFHTYVRKSTNTLIKTRDFESSNEKDLSVYIIGIDSVSRLNIIRGMPKMYKKLSKDWVELKGYNKIEYNTFPNIIAATTGLNVSRLLETCLKGYEKPLDDCDFVWKKPSKRGYVTFFAEDEPSYSTFNYEKFGFLQAPTDHYMRPFLIAAQMLMNKYPSRPFPQCLGPEYIVDHLFNYLFDFTVEYKENPKFALLWSNSFSHDDVNGVSAFDDKYVSYFDHLETLGVYESSLIVFMSDHGARFGGIRQTHSGWMEERLPFIFFHFPEWWIKENPAKYQTLQSNRDKLTTPYDLYLTLKEALEGEANEGTWSCPKCRSLFTPIPWNRSCEDAGVPLEWCACDRHMQINETNPVVQNAALQIVKEINNLLFERPDKEIATEYSCAKLQLKSIKKAFKKIFYEDDQSDFVEYIAIVETTPGDGIFEATIRYITKKWLIFSYGGRYEIIGTISRLNKYETQSSCIFNQPVKRNYCFCQKTPP